MDYLISRSLQNIEDLEGPEPAMFTKKTQTEKDRAERKVNIAIDKMIDLQAAGFACDAVSRILEQLNALKCRILES